MTHLTSDKATHKLREDRCSKFFRNVCTILSDFDSMDAVCVCARVFVCVCVCIYIYIQGVSRL